MARTTTKTMMTTNKNRHTQEFVLNLSILSRGTLDEKLEWTFQLYDVNGDGFISKDEMTEVMTSVYELMGKVSEGCKEENQIKAKVENMFKVRFSDSVCVTVTLKTLLRDIILKSFRKRN